jgi:hypothetical protein
LKHRIHPTVIKPFDSTSFHEISLHVGQIRRAYDWPGLQPHDHSAEVSHRFNRWFWHNLPLLRKFHHDPKFIAMASKICGQPLKPSYCFLSMYTADGVCPPHTDRPQCQFTVDLQVSSDGSWPIYVEDKPHVLADGEALVYSGTGQEHYRKPMKEDGKSCTRMDLAFFHFVPTDWMGALE